MQQGGQLKDQFGGLSGATRALASVFTVGRVVALGMAGGVAAVAAAAYEGWRESTRLRDAILLTGNAAGMTEGRFNSLAESIAASSTATIGDAREMTLALAETGRIGAHAMDAAARAAVAMQKATGASIVKDFARAYNGVAKWAQEANQRYHFLTVEQYKLIAAMEKHGKTNEALAITFDALARPFKAHEENLGSLERFWRSLTQKVSEYQDAVLSIGRTKTLQEELAEVEKGIANLEQQQRRGTIRPGRDAGLDGLRERRLTIIESLRFQGRAADSSAGNAAREEAAIAAVSGRTPKTFDQLYPPANVAGIIGSASEAARLRQNEAAGYGATDMALREQAQREYEAIQQRNERNMRLHQEYTDWWTEQQAMMVEWAKPEWQKLAERWENTTLSMQEASKRFTDGFVDAGRSAFEEFMRTGKLSADGFKQVFLQTLTELIYDRLIAKQMGLLANTLWDYVANGMAGGGWGFGDSGGGMNFTGMDEYGGARAAGGPVSAGRTYLVDERGPELLRMGGQGGYVVPNSATRAMGGVNITQHITVGQGASYAEVYRAATMAKDAAVAEIEQRILRGNRVYGA